jgi:predicted permease
MDKWIEFVRAIIRPALVIAFVSIFLWIVISITPAYFSQSMADLIFKTFIDAVVLIVGIWIGGRIAKAR